MFAGNGGSAADAQHFAGELVSRFQLRSPGYGPPWRLRQTRSNSDRDRGMTTGYERASSRQIEALGRSGDVFVGISTSGQSPNVLAGLKARRAFSD